MNWGCVTPSGSSCTTAAETKWTNTGTGLTINAGTFSAGFTGIFYLNVGQNCATSENTGGSNITVTFGAPPTFSNYTINSVKGEEELNPQVLNTITAGVTSYGPSSSQGWTVQIQSESGAVLFSSNTNTVIVPKYSLTPGSMVNLVVMFHDTFGPMATKTIALQVLKTPIPPTSMISLSDGNGNAFNATNMIDPADDNIEIRTQAWTSPTANGTCTYRFGWVPDLPLIVPNSPPDFGNVNWLGSYGSPLLGTISSGTMKAPIPGQAPQAILAVDCSDVYAIQNIPLPLAQPSINTSTLTNAINTATATPTGTPSTITNQAITNAETLVNSALTSNLTPDQKEAVITAASTVVNSNFLSKM